MSHDPWAHVPPPPPPPTDRFMSDLDTDFEYKDSEEDEYIQSLPPKLRKTYLEKVGIEKPTTAWADEQRSKRVMWWLALPIAFAIACFGFVIGMVLVATLILAPVGLFLMFGAAAPLGLLIIWRVTHVNGRY